MVKFPNWERALRALRAKLSLVLHEPSQSLAQLRNHQAQLSWTSSSALPHRADPKLGLALAVAQREGGGEKLQKGGWFKLFKTLGNGGGLPPSFRDRWCK